MSLLYFTEQGGKIRLRKSQLEFTKKGNTICVPIETVEAVVIIGNISLSTSFLQYALKNGVPVTFFSTRGRFYGKLESTKSISATKQKYQFSFLENQELRLSLSRNIVEAKLNNQIIALKRQNRRQNNPKVIELISRINNTRIKLPGVKSIEELRGYEGISARNYFEGMSKLIAREFSFSGRTRMPPKDPFNSLISLGYTLLMYEIYNSLIINGLNPYVGFYHELKQNHPCLCSDLLEEWRSVLIDPLALYLLNKGVLKRKDFHDDYQGGVFLYRESLKEYIRKYEERMRTENSYLDYKGNMLLTYRECVNTQAKQYFQCILNRDVSLYHPLKVR